MRRLALLVIPSLLLAMLVGSATANASVTPTLTTSQTNDSETLSQRARATAALAAAQALFAHGPNANSTIRDYREATDGVAPRDPSMILLTLSRALPYLSRTQRAAAHALLARPDDPTPPRYENDSWGPVAVRYAHRTCTSQLCVHWTSVGRNAPPLTDNNHNGIPDQVDNTKRVFSHVWQAEVTHMGFRAPLPDTLGSYDNKDPRFDIYLSDIGGSGLYGYTSPDAAYYHVRQPAYIVVDDDFAPSQFPVHTPLQNLQVTAAHEFNHAIQYAYDATEDAWIMESTSTWVEDQVYTSINDNRQYLPQSNFTHPLVPLDYGQQMWWYGNWIFLRSITESLHAAFVVRLWQNLAVVNSHNLGAFSTQGLQETLASYGSSLPVAYARFSAWNQAPGSFYSEGQAYQPQPPARTLTPGKGKPPRVGTVTLRHLTSYAVRIDTRQLSKGDTVTVTVKGLTKLWGRDVVVTRPNRGHSTITQQPVVPKTPITLTYDGKEKYWTVVVANGSWQVNRKTCYSGSTRYSCRGATPLNDSVPVTVTASVTS